MSPLAHFRLHLRKADCIGRSPIRIEAYSHPTGILVTWVRMCLAYPGRCPAWHEGKRAAVDLGSVLASWADEKTVPEVGYKMPTTAGRYE